MIATVFLWLVVMFVSGLLIAGFMGAGTPASEAQARTMRWLLLVLVIALAALSMGGCSTMRPDGYGTEWKHDSGIFTGRPFGSAKEEDSLDVWNNYVYWQRGNWYVEAGVGLKLGEGGFYLDGPPVVFNGRIGKRFSFK